MKTDIRIAVLASTRGSILPEMFLHPVSGTKYVLLLTNKEHCEAREKAQVAGISDVFLSTKKKTREQWDRAAVAILQESQIDLILLVGYMRILSPFFAQEYSGKILNIHPSLLPLHAGGMNMDVHRAVLQGGEAQTGSTVHLVTEEVDGGAVIAQSCVLVEKNDTPESLQKKVQAQEAELYGVAIERWKKRDKKLIPFKTIDFFQKNP